MREIKIIGGRFKDKIFKLEGTVQEVCGDSSLPMLASRGNYAALNAMEIDKYKHDDAPFYYGKIGGLGYIIAKKDLALT